MKFCINVKVPKKLLQAEFGFRIGGSSKFTVSKTSPALKKGQYIKAYWREYYDGKAVKQDHILHYKLTIMNDEGFPISTTMESMVLGTEEVRGYKPLMPQIKMDICNGATRSGGDNVVKTYIYTYVDGAWVEEVY